MPTSNLTLNRLPKTFKISPLWRTLAKSGHTANELVKMSVASTGVASALTLHVLSKQDFT